MGLIDKSLTRMPESIDRAVQVQKNHYRHKNWIPIFGGPWIHRPSSNSFASLF